MEFNTREDAKGTTRMMRDPILTLHGMTLTWASTCLAKTLKTNDSR